jgi:hypothetical protein
MSENFYNPISGRVRDFVSGHRWNLHRRHMTTGQKAALAVELKPKFEAMAKERQIRKPSDSVQANLPEQKCQSRDQAGRAVGVSGRTRAKGPPV